MPLPEPVQAGLPPSTAAGSAQGVAVHAATKNAALHGPGSDLQLRSGLSLLSRTWPTIDHGRLWPLCSCGAGADGDA